MKTINNIADYNFYFSMDRLKAKLPTPGHLTVNFFPAPGHFTVNFFPAPGHLCAKILLTPGMPGGGGMVRVRIERDIIPPSQLPEDGPRNVRNVLFIFLDLPLIFMSNRLVDLLIFTSHGFFN